MGNPFAAPYPMMVHQVNQSAIIQEHEDEQKEEPQYAIEPSIEEGEEATLKVAPEARSTPSTASTEGKESGKDPKNYYNTR